LMLCTADAGQQGNGVENCGTAYRLESL